MKTEKNISRNLAQSAFVMNVIGGGISMVTSFFNRYKDHYLVQLGLPGVDDSQLSIEISGQDIIVYHLMQFDQELRIPYLLQRVQIPAEVNFREITANFEQGKLLIRLPFNELADGYSRQVDILRG